MTDKQESQTMAQLAARLDALEADNRALRDLNLRLASAKTAAVDSNDPMATVQAMMADQGSIAKLRNPTHIHDHRYAALEYGPNGYFALPRVKRRKGAPKEKDFIFEMCELPPWLPALDAKYTVMRLQGMSRAHHEAIVDRILSAYPAGEAAAVRTRIYGIGGAGVDWRAVSESGNFATATIDGLFAEVMRKHQHLAYVEGAMAFLNAVSGKYFEEIKRICTRFDVIEEGQPPPAWYTAVAFEGVALPPATPAVSP